MPWLRQVKQQDAKRVLFDNDEDEKVPGTKKTGTETGRD